MTIPASVTEIARSAFENCEKLAEVILAPDSALETIGANAFAGCAALADRGFADGVKNVDPAAFGSADPGTPVEEEPEAPVGEDPVVPGEDPVVPEGEDPVVPGEDPEDPEAVDDPRVTYPTATASATAR